jgi:predicted HAD superfamily Cof-like phosphohydrolase
MCEAFGQDVHHELHKPDGDVRALRIALLVEETKEYLAAEQQDNIVEIADGLADIVVIAYGTACAYGIDLDAVLAEVYRSNMSKVIDGEVIYNEMGKVTKPDTYSPPAIADVIGHMDGDPWSEQAAA